ncbi:hypothetical protein BpHYR1_038474 [Brachionus plicatilis]|uniref:Uncharacterized protein n=1 Tax=Brachionus plicatilis TaxID=10195 RepID=A0A3M7RND0_BRAPC|nr:hypothetical protein BpHYR1_038474 [Brachionus plicatilis]
MCLDSLANINVAFTTLLYSLSFGSDRAVQLGVYDHYFRLRTIYFESNWFSVVHYPNSLYFNKEHFTIGQGNVKFWYKNCAKMVLQKVQYCTN